VVSSLKQGKEVTLLGISEDKKHGVVDNPVFPGVMCWTVIDHLIIDPIVMLLLETIDDPLIATFTPTSPPTNTPPPRPTATCDRATKKCP
jgi:hypothetical protein